MSRSAAAPARRRSAPARRPAARRAGIAEPLRRRLSGPAPKRAPAPSVALPARVLRAPFARAARARTGSLLDALLQGRAWIALVAILLAGIVFFNVDLLQLNRQIATTSERTAKVKRENAALKLQLAKLGSSERIQRVAARRGLKLPAPGDVRYLDVRPGRDGRLAAGRIVAPGTDVAPPAAAAPPTAQLTPTAQTQTQAPAGAQPQAPPAASPPAAAPDQAPAPAPAPSAPATPTGAAGAPAAQGTGVE